MLRSCCLLAGVRILSFDKDATDYIHKVLRMLAPLLLAIFWSLNMLELCISTSLRENASFAAVLGLTSFVQRLLDKVLKNINVLISSYFLVSMILYIRSMLLF